MSDLVGRHILVGVSGGIAAYKSAQLVRDLRAAGAEVRVAMTRAAQEFIRPLTFQALSGQQVHTDLFDAAAEAAMGHIELARWAQQIVIAPASADIIARLAHGMADDLLGAICLATTAPVSVVPAMNRQMWLAPATVANVESLRARGVSILGPDSGSQACGDVGPGRMIEPSEIVSSLAAQLQPGPLQGFHVVVTAGPTREAIDPVRFISNASSGRMGFAVARAAQRAGARVTLVCGPVALETPPGVHRIDVVSARDMLDAVVTAVNSGCNLFIAAAAVGDYSVDEIAVDKIKKTESALALTLVRTPDILGRVALLPNAPFTVGFAAETRDLERNAREKLEKKKLNMIAGNQVGVAGAGFESEFNALHVFWPGGDVILPRATKDNLARSLMALIVDRYRAEHPG